MLNVSTDFKTAIKQLAVYSNAKFDLKYDSTTISFDNDDIISIEVFGSALNDDKVLGNLAQHSLTIKVHGDLTKSINLAKLNTIEPYFGVMITGGTYEYVKYQDFLITDINYSDTNNQTTITATDYLTKLNNELWVDTNTYPMTLKAYTESVLTFCGLSLENISFLNSDFSITSQPIPDYTNCKTIIERVAEMALSFVVINKTTNKVEFKNAFGKFFSYAAHDYLSGFTHTELSTKTHGELVLRDIATPYEYLESLSYEDLEAYSYFELESLMDSLMDSVSKDNYWSLKLNDHNFGTNGINTLVLKISQVDGENNTVENATNVAIDGAIEVVIEDNPFINTEALRLSVIDNMFSVIDGYMFIPYSVEYRGFPYLELGDVVEITKMNSDTIHCPIYETNIKFNGGLYGKLVAKALNKTQTSYKYVSNTNNRVRGVEVKVDKVNGDFTILAGHYYNGELEATGRYVFDGTGAYFYSDAFKLYDNSVVPVLKVYFDTVNSRYVFNGEIQATTGNISGNLTVGTTSVNAGLSGSGTSSTSIRIWAGYATPSTSADFYVRDDGYAKMANATIAGWTVNSTSIYKGAIKLDSANERIYFNTGAYFEAGAGTTDFKMTGTLTPASAGGSSLGSSTLYWASSYFSLILPYSNGAGALGSTTLRWGDVWCTDGAFNGSDIRLKKDVMPIEKGVDLILKLEPVQYKWKEKNRNHYGLIAQQVKKVFDELGIDSGIYADPKSAKDYDEEKDPDAYLALRYTELIAPLIQTVQYLKQEIDILKNK